MKIPENIKKLFNPSKYMAFATSSKDSIPNVVAIGSQKIVDNDTIWIIDTYFNKTKKNLLENPLASIAFWETSANGFQIKGEVAYLTKGATFEKAKEWILSLRPGKKVKGVVEFKIKEIYSIQAIPDLAGKKIA